MDLLKGYSHGGFDAKVKFKSGDAREAISKSTSTAFLLIRGGCARHLKLILGWAVGGATFLEVLKGWHWTTLYYVPR